MEFTIGQKIQLPKDYLITPLGLKTLKYKLVTWEVIEIYSDYYGERLVLKYKKIEHDTMKDKTIQKIEYLKSIN